MYQDRETSPGDFSDWQKNRIRCCLFAFYLSKKGKGYSANALAYEICLHPSTKLESHINKKYFDANDLNSDLGLPVRGNNLNKWFNGINATDDHNQRKFRRFQNPEDHLVYAAYTFLQAKGWITIEQFIEPKSWPKSRSSISPSIATCSDDERKMLLPYFCRDFKLTEPLEVQILSISGDTSDDDLKVRVSGSVNSFLQTIRSSDVAYLSYDVWTHLWGWMQTFTKNLAIISLEDLSAHNSERIDLLLIKSTQKSAASLYAKDLQFINVSGLSNGELLPLIHSFSEDSAQKIEPEHDLSYGILKELSLTNYLKQYNMYFERYGSSDWLFSDAQAVSPTSFSTADVDRIKDAIRNIIGDHKYNMDSSKPTWQRMFDRLGIEYDRDRIELMVIEDCSDRERLGQRLHWGIIHNSDPQDIPKLIRAGVDINFRDEFGKTPLHTAAWYTRGNHIRELAKCPDIDFLALTNCGALASTLHLERPIYQYPAITRYLSMREKKQALASTPPVDYHELNQSSVTRNGKTPDAEQTMSDEGPKPNQ